MGVTKYKVYDISDPIEPKEVFKGSMKEVADYLDITEHYARKALSDQNRVSWKFIIRKEEE